MRKSRRVIILLIILLIIMQNIMAIANVIEIGDVSIIERGDLGFYSVQYWNESQGIWKYITYSRTYYTDSKGIKRIAYCINPDLNGIGWIKGEVESAQASIKEQLSDERLWRIYKNGYPYKSIQELGVETEDDAYLATKQAAYCIIKQRPLEDVYNYYRVGDTEINGQNLEDIQRRGEKVISAIYKLVNIGYNGTEKQELALINTSGKFIQDEKDEYYSQKYNITKTNNKTNIIIENLNRMPEGTYVSDIDGNEKYNFESGESFKIMVPKANIITNYNIEVQYKIIAKSYPVYYAKNNNENMQNYVIIADENKEDTGKFYYGIDGHRSNIKVIKKDEETQVPIKGALFEITNERGSIVGRGRTDGMGEINFRNILQGKINLREIESNENYVLDTTDKEIILGFKEDYIINITNIHKKGSLEVNKVDKDNNEKSLEGVEFDLINENGENVSHIITNNNGQAIIENINIGNYILKETKTLEEYKIGIDEPITINWNEIAKIKIENEKKKGNIKVKKVDKDNKDIYLEGVELQIFDTQDNIIENLKTDKNGEATALNLPIGLYYIKELKTNNNYVLNTDKIPIEIIEDKQTDIIIENEKIKGKIKIIKTSEDKNIINNLEEGSPISNVKFEIYNEKEEKVSEIITNKNGIAESEKLVKGKYKIKEIESGEWYLLNNEIYQAEIINNEETVEIKVKNKSVNPELDIEKIGPEKAEENEEIKYEFNIQNKSNVILQNFKWFDFLPYKQGKITKFSTGRYNQELKYNLYYKTNKKIGYMVLKKDLLSTENNYIDLSNIYLEDDEKITQIKAEFGDVDIGFRSIENPYIYIKLNEKIYTDTKILNETILEGWYKTYKVCDQDDVITKIENKQITKKLPRTGF